MEHPPASSAIADHAAIITELRSLLDDANADIARRHLDMNKAMGRVYAAEARIEDRDATITAICSELAEARKDRASIVAFLAAEAGRFDRSARSASGDFVYDKRALEISCDKLRAQADIIRSLAAQIARGDDRQGGE